MKVIKFENTGCPACDRAGLFIKGVEAEDVVVSKMPFIEADDAVLAGTLQEPIMNFPVFVVFDKDGNEVEGKRMNGFDSGRSGELMELIEFARANQ